MKGDRTERATDRLAAMVLAAGFGTRLRPLSDWRAKPLVPVGDRPVLAHVVRRLREAGIERIVVNAHHRPDDVRCLAEKEGLVVSVEEEILGTAGGLARARRSLEFAAVLVWNGDIFAACDVEGLAEEHRRTHADATLLMERAPPGVGNIGVDDAGRVVRLRDERIGGECAGGFFLGIHVVGEALLSGLPGRGCLVGDVYIPALRRGAFVQSWAHDGPWHDIGSPQTLLRANLAWLLGRGETSWIHPCARVAGGALIDACLVGAGALVDGAGRLERVVVLPGAVASAPLSDAIVAPEGIVDAAG